MRQFDGMERFWTPGDAVIDEATGRIFSAPDTTEAMYMAAECEARWRAGGEAERVVIAQLEGMHEVTQQIRAERAQLRQPPLAPEPAAAIAPPAAPSAPAPAVAPAAAPAAITPGQEVEGSLIPRTPAPAPRPPVVPIRLYGVAAALTEVERLDTLLQERDRLHGYAQAITDARGHYTSARRAHQAIDLQAAFTPVYREPALALARYTELRATHGAEGAQQLLLTQPARLGELRDAPAGLPAVSALAQPLQDHERTRHALLEAQHGLAIAAALPPELDFEQVNHLSFDLRKDITKRADRLTQAIEAAGPAAAHAAVRTAFERLDAYQQGEARRFFGARLAPFLPPARPAPSAPDFANRLNTTIDSSRGPSRGGWER